METSSKSKVLKRKHKKKAKVPDKSHKPILKPGDFNGLSNWVKMQKILGPVANNTSIKGPEENNKFVLKKPTKDHKFSPVRTKIFYSNGAKEESADVKSAYYSNVVKAGGADVSLKKSYAVVASQHLKTVSKTDKSEPFAFNFNESATIQMEQDSNVNVQSRDFSLNKGTKLTKAVAMDCEMVGTGPTGEDSIIARVSIVNSYGDVLYDDYVKPKEKVTDYRTQISGVRPSDLKNGKDLFDVQNDVLGIIEGKILVGHSIKHDLAVLFINHPRQLLRDTAYYRPFRDLCGGKTPSLKKLSSMILGCDIQGGEHSSVEDAQAAMLLYLRQRREWEYLEKQKEKRRLKFKKKTAE